MTERSIKIFSGSSNIPLAQEIVKYLGVDLSHIEIGKFNIIVSWGDDTQETFKLDVIEES